jgi:hypothetical protein
VVLVLVHVHDGRKLKDVDFGFVVSWLSLR